MNLASFIINPLDWCFPRDQRLLGGCAVMTGSVTGSGTIPLIVAAISSPTIQRL